ncbi:hypothetical protein OH77DRAFT_1076898 [Trametes cingulata]|nr:hypothetical protein OH77DRAFT_1076898 [Trametes cingulata]
MFQLPPRPPDSPTRLPHPDIRASTLYCIRLYYVVLPARCAIRLLMLSTLGLCALPHILITSLCRYSHFPCTANSPVCLFDCIALAPCNLCMLF